MDLGNVESEPQALGWRRDFCENPIKMMEFCHRKMIFHV